MQKSSKITKQKFFLFFLSTIGQAGSLRDPW